MNPVTKPQDNPPQISLRVPPPVITIGQGCKQVYHRTFEVRLPCKDGQREVLVMGFEGHNDVIYPERDDHKGGTLPPVVICVSTPKVLRVRVERCSEKAELHVEEVTE